MAVKSRTGIAPTCALCMCALRQASAILYFIVRKLVEAVNIREAELARPRAANSQTLHWRFTARALGQDEALSKTTNIQYLVSHRARSPSHKCADHWHCSMSSSLYTLCSAANKYDGASCPERPKKHNFQQPSRRHPTLLILCSEHEKVGWSDNHKTASAEIESFVITFYQSDNLTVHSMPFSIQAFKWIGWNFVENVRANAEGDVMRSFFFFFF